MLGTVFFIFVEDGVKEAKLSCLSLEHETRARGVSFVRERGRSQFATIAGIADGKRNMSEVTFFVGSGDLNATSTQMV
eukprot:snap_masked-scaffold_3-processed-gene-19.49-mRNA-1 protein AED:1.00 eAED:1.00 QI:0/0/0/0/1/1/3/0/77